MPRRREAVCDSLFCTLVVVVPVVTALIVYRNNVRQLLKILFVGFLLFGAFVSSRHLFFRAARQLRNYLWRRQSQEEEEEEAEGPRPEQERGREEARRRAQKVHDIKAEDYDTRIAGPRREERLRRMEEQMRSIRGFRGEGQTLGGEGPASSSLGQRQLRDPVADSQRQLGNRHHVTGDSGSMTSHGDHVTEKDESGDRHVTEQSEERGRVVTLGLRLRDRTVRKQFYTTDTVQALYTWMESLRYSPEDYCIATRLPKQLLLDTHKTLQDCGLVSDTTLVVEERE